MGHSELTEAPDHNCASLFCSKCVNSMPQVILIKVTAVVNTAEPNGTWSKRDIEELVGTYHNYEDWLKR